MASMKTRAAFTGGKFLITHPQARITRLVVRFVARRISRKVVAASRIEAVPATRGSRLTTVVGVAVVAGGVVFITRRAAKRSARRKDAAPAPFPVAAPFPASAATPPETRDAPSITPTTSPASEQAAAAPVAVGDPDRALEVRVEAKLSDAVPGADLQVEALSGVVTLRGQVSDEEAESRVVRDAEQVEGVKAVQSELQTAGAEPESPSS